MKDTPQMAFLVQPPLIIRTEPGSVTPSARHGFEFQPGAIGLQLREQLGAEVHCSDLSSLGRFHLSAEGRGPFDSDGVLTNIHVPRLKRDRFAGSHACFRHEDEEHPVTRVQKPIVLQDAHCVVKHLRLGSRHWTKTAEDVILGELGDVLLFASPDLYSRVSQEDLVLHGITQQTGEDGLDDAETILGKRLALHVQCNAGENRRRGGVWSVTEWAVPFQLSPLVPPLVAARYHPRT
jgi:hypothetical protein